MQPGRLFAYLAALLQVLIPVLAFATMPVAPEAATGEICLYHTGDEAPAPDGHKMCPVCAACSVLSAFVLADAPAVPLPRAPALLTRLVERVPSRPASLLPEVRARAPPILS